MTERHSSYVDRTIRLTDGRRLGYAEYGDPDGLPVLYYHGAPSTRLDAQVAHVPALQKGVRLIAVDRPGLGLSDFKAKRRLLDWPDDITQLVDHLSLGGFSQLAISGGGPHALACALKMPDQVRDTAILNTFVPGGIRMNQANLSLANRFMGAILPRLAPWALAMVYRRVARIAADNPQLLLHQLEEMLPSEDRDVMAKPEMVEAFFDTSHETFRSGVEGAVWETRLTTLAWEFEASEIRTPIWLFHGESNNIVPAEALREFAQKLSKCTVRILPGHGHIPLPNMYASALTVLVDEARSPSRL